MAAVRRARAAARCGAGLAAALSLCAIGCGGGSDGAAATATPAAAPASGLRAADVPEDCRLSVPPGAKGAPASLLGPPGRIAVKEISGNQVTGFVDKTPGQFLAGWQARKDVQIDGENEGVEGEVYVAAGEQSLEWRLRKVCLSGSVFTAIVR